MPTDLGTDTTQGQQTIGVAVQHEQGQSSRAKIHEASKKLRNRNDSSSEERQKMTQCAESSSKNANKCQNSMMEVRAT